MSATVRLSCGHERTYKTEPSRGEMVYCPPCSVYRDVDKASPRYNIRCGQCTLGRRGYGANYDSAVRAAHKHVRTRQTHIVSIVDGEIVVARVANGDGMLPITINVTTSQGHQQNLRNVIKP